MSSDSRSRASVRAGAPEGTLRLRSFLSAHWQWLFLGQVAGVLGTLALVKVAASSASPAVFGSFALVLAVAFGVAGVLFAPVAGWALRHYQEAHEDDRLRGYYDAVVVALLAMTAVTALLAALAITFLRSELRRMDFTPGMLVAAAALGVGVGYSDSAVTIANAAFFRRAAAFFLAVTSWSRVLAIGVAYAFGVRSAVGFGTSLAVAVLALVPLQAIQLRRSEVATRFGAPQVDRAYLRSLAEYTLPLFAIGIPSYVVGFGDRLLLAYFSSPVMVGIYAAMAAATINLTNAAGAAANRVLEPTLFAASGAGADPDRVRPALRMVNLTTGIIVASGAPFVLAYVIWPRPVISLFTSSDYHRGGRLLWLLLVASILFLASQQLTYNGLILKRPQVYVPLRFLHAGVLAGGLLFAIPRWGLSGMVVAIFAAHAFQLALVLATNRLRLRVPAAPR